MPRTKQKAATTSPQGKLSAVIKSARDAMRKDAGLNGDLDRIPQLAWLLFLKAFDGLEENREVTEVDFRPAIEPPYRWRDWATDPNGSTGDILLKFINDDLLPHLRGLVGTGSHDPRDVLAAVFKETFNRMLSGYLLRDVINKVNEINFASSDDIHTMAHLYESMLREMRDAAGDSGEFYTPRPLIRFIVQQVDPKLDEVVLDLVVSGEAFRPNPSNQPRSKGQQGTAKPKPTPKSTAGSRLPLDQRRPDRRSVPPCPVWHPFVIAPWRAKVTVQIGSHRSHQLLVPLLHRCTLAPHARWTEQQGKGATGGATRQGCKRDQALMCSLPTGNAVNLVKVVNLDSP